MARSALHLPPVPRGAPLLGSALALRRDPLGTLERARRERGDVVRLVAGPPGVRQNLYAVFHPDGVRRVLSAEADRYRKDNRFYAELRWALGDGLLNSQDERWRRQRRFVQPMLTRRRTAGYAAAIAEEAERLVARWAPAAAAGRPVDLHAEMSRATLRIVGRILFGAEVERALPVVAHAFPLLGAYARDRAYAPIALPRAWRTPATRRALAAREQLHAVCAQLIGERRATGPAGDDLLSLLVAARDGEDALRDEEVRDQVLIFLLAGHDTTAIALTVALHLLGHHPEAQRRVQEEVDAVLADRAPDADDLAALPTTAMVLKEAMRIYPPAWAMGRRTADGDRIGPYDLPPGADVTLSPWVTHRHPGYWEDPERFDPDRFAPEREGARHKHAYFPFGAGPRACIGQHFSMLEAVIALAAIVRAYALETPAVRLALAPRITLHPAGPVPCRLVPRQEVTTVQGSTRWPVTSPAAT